MARVNEVNNLRWSDIDRDNGIIWLGNSNSSTKPRHSIPLNDHLLQLFNDCKRLVDPDTYPFIFNFKDKRRILQTACRKAGVPYRAFHAIRRGMATALVEKNVHVKHIADLLGHHSLKHTRRYLKRSDQTLKRIMDGV
jgi:integrase